MFRNRKFLLIGASALALAATAGGGFLIGKSSASPSSTDAVLTSQPIASSPPTLPLLSAVAAAETDERGVMTLAPLLERTSPAVVNIATESTAPVAMNPFMSDPFFRRFFDLPENLPPQRRRSAGSGVIIDAEKGHVLTNHHVIDKADSIMVTLDDGRRMEAEVIGSDAATDVALLKIEADRLTQIPLGNSDTVKAGDVVIAIGNPFGLNQTVTSGIVSATGRSGLSSERYEDFIQTDAPINPGNSGGALINSRGELIGLNTAIIAPGGGNVGIGFAVPANMAKAVMDQLIETGEVRRGQIGIFIQTLTPDLAEALDLEVTGGALVSQVEEDTPAGKAGVKAGDVVIAVNGEPIETSSDLRNAVGLTPVGEEVRLTVLRDGRERTIRVDVAEAETEEISGDEAGPKLRGATLTRVPDTIGNRNGAYVSAVTPGSPADRLGLRQGDVIRAVNRKPVKSVSELERELEGAKAPFALSIDRGGATLFLVVR